MKLNYYLENVDNLIVKNIFGNGSSTQLLSGLLGLQVVSNPDHVLQTIISNLSSVLLDLLNPDIQLKNEEKMKEKRQYLTKMARGFNQTNAFNSFFTVIWLSKLPCFDLYGITSEEFGEKVRYTPEVKILINF